MDDLLRFIRTSSTRIFGSRVRSRPPSEPEDALAASSPSDARTLSYLLTPCRHVPENKWEEVWTEAVEPRFGRLTGIVFLNPNFARTCYVPQSAFRCDYDDQVEFGLVGNELLAAMKTGRYEQLMGSIIRPDAAFVQLHVCQAALLLDRLAARCPGLVRLSAHYFYLDDGFIVYAVRHLPHLVALNLENCVGLSRAAYGNLGLLPKLAHLNLAGCDISESGLAKILERCEKLESLDLSNNCLITGNCFASEEMLKIKRLNIRDCWGITAGRLIEMVAQRLPNLFELICNSGVNDESLAAIGVGCGSLMHLDISFEEFTYNDDTGLNLLTEAGFGALAKLTELRVLRLRHVGRLTDQALASITGACGKLTELTLNLRHRHKLSDQCALALLGRHCPKLKYFEAVHNHFVGKHSLAYLGQLAETLKYVILRGDELVTDAGAAQLISTCPNLRTIILDGCRDVAEKTLSACIVHADNLPEDSTGKREPFQASLVCTAIDRSMVSELASKLPSNLHIRASDQRRNKEHFSEFDGKRATDLKLRHAFFPFYWHDFN